MKIAKMRTWLLNFNTETIGAAQSECMIGSNTLSLVCRSNSSSIFSFNATGTERGMQNFGVAHDCSQREL